MAMKHSKAVSGRWSDENYLSAARKPLAWIDAERWGYKLAGRPENVR